jgi:hypothetical protein
MTDLDRNELERRTIQRIRECADPEAALQVAIATLEKLLAEMQIDCA